MILLKAMAYTDLVLTISIISKSNSQNVNTLKTKDVQFSWNSQFSPIVSIHFDYYSDHHYSFTAVCIIPFIFIMHFHFLYHVHRKTILSRNSVHHLIVFLFLFSAIRPIFVLPLISFLFL